MAQASKRRKILSVVVPLANAVRTICISSFPLMDYFDDDLEELPETERQKVIRITGYLEKIIPQFSARQFQMHFRINRNTFETLVPLIHNIIKKDGVIGRPKLDTEKQILVTLWLLATPDSYRSVGDRFDIGKSSLSKSFFRVINALNHLAAKIIKWPSIEQQERIKDSFYNIAGVDNVIGAIDGTFIPIKAPKNNPEVYVTRKCNYAFTLQAICDSSLKFIDCFIGYPGSVSDTRIFKNSDIYHAVNENTRKYFPNEKYIVGDKAYPILSWCIAPYIDRGNLNPAKRNFNLKISQTRQVIERSFALLFGRFRRLKYLDMNKTNFVPATVLASCVLHNLCLDTTDLYVDEYYQEGVAHVLGNDENQPNILLNQDINNRVHAAHAKRDEICTHLFNLED